MPPSRGCSTLPSNMVAQGSTLTFDGAKVRGVVYGSGVW